jgi:LPS sulfotransferase NodH
MNPSLRSLALKIQDAFNGYDSSARGPERQFKHPSLYPIFIVGAPRTGSTLLYQLMVKHTGVAFISNIMALVPKKMLFIAKHTNHWMNRIEDVEENDLGYIPGPFSPNEAGAIMRLWFDREVGREERRVIRNTVISLSDIFGAPFAGKNLFNSFRLVNIHQVFPEARFINVRRDPLFAAQSILLVRRNRLGDERAWWSCTPEGYQNVLEQHPLYQVLWQVKKVEEAVSEFLHSHSPVYLEVTYEALCQNTEKTLRSIASHLGLEYRRDSEVDQLSPREDRRLSESEWNELLEYYSILYQQGEVCASVF